MLCLCGTNWCRGLYLKEVLKLLSRYFRAAWSMGWHTCLHKSILPKMILFIVPTYMNDFGSFIKSNAWWLAEGANALYLTISLPWVAFRMKDWDGRSFVSHSNAEDTFDLKSRKLKAAKKYGGKILSLQKSRTLICKKIWDDKFILYLAEAFLNSWGQNFTDPSVLASAFLLSTGRLHSLGNAMPDNVLQI